MKRGFLLCALLSVGLIGCANSNPKHMPQANLVDASEAGKVLIYRHASLQAALAKAYVGVESGYFSKLDENQYVEFEVDPGFHLFKTRAHGSVSSQSHIKVTAGELVCLEARPNYEEMEWLAVPFLNALVPSFVLEETACLRADELRNLTLVELNDE